MKVMEDAVRSMLIAIGEDAYRDGLVDTPKRVAVAWAQGLSGYDCDVERLFKIFEEPHCDEMVVLRDIEFCSYCEHHMMPFLGVGHIGYIPLCGKVIGVSKLARILDCFAKRLQIQERIGQQVVEALEEFLEPAGCGCVLEASHLCIKCRGVGKQRSTMVTSSMRGVFRDNELVRNEFLRMIGK